MSVLEVFRIALLDLALHKFRSALAALGIIFGVASVIAMLSISEGARREAIGRISALGVDNVLARSVKPPKADTQDAGKGRRYVLDYGLRRRDLEHVRNTFACVRWVVGLRDMRQNLYASSGKALDVRVMATEPAYLDITRSAIARGRFLTLTDGATHKRVCVVGIDAARKFFAFHDPLDGSVRIGSDWYRVVGILTNPAALKAPGGEDVNNYVFIPLATAQATYGDTSIQYESGSSTAVRVELDGIAMKMTDSEAVLDTARRLETYLGKTHKRKDYELLVPLELMRQKDASQRIFSIVMATIAGISLLVGGIGIMNIMLANVRERRKEIGTRRALGARRRDIFRQFLIEAAVLTTLGGLVGVAVGYLLAGGVSTYARWPTVVTAASIIMGLGVSAMVGILSGMWPARQAARVSPIEALRSE
jgi:putative ABC transport system permease protein